MTDNKNTPIDIGGESYTSDFNLEDKTKNPSNSPSKEETKNVLEVKKEAEKISDEEAKKLKIAKRKRVDRKQDVPSGSPTPEAKETINIIAEAIKKEGKSH